VLQGAYPIESVSVAAALFLTKHAGKPSSGPYNADPDPPKQNCAVLGPFDSAHPRDAVSRRRLRKAEARLLTWVVGGV
jgi:hypothetical protein